MSDLKIFGIYNLFAKLAPGFLFLISIYFLLEYDMSKLQTNSVVYIVLLIILSFVCSSISASLIKFVETFLWSRIQNPTIRYLKVNSNELYQNLLKQSKNDDDILNHILKATRKDEKLLWKNITYGFFRNSFLLSLICLIFSYKKEYFCINITVCFCVLIMTFISSYLYAKQAILSYKESTKTKNE